MTDEKYNNLLKAWGVKFAGLDMSVEIEGSPERTAARAVALDSSGGRWILERIEPDNVARKQIIAGRLVALSGLHQIHPYQKTTDGSFFADHHMIRPYIDGIPLNRKTYLNDLWRIDAMSDFLIQFRKQTATHPAVPAPLPGRGIREIPSTGGVREAGGGFFSIAAYAENRMAVWHKKYSKLAEKLDGSFSKLRKNFFPVHDQLPTAFCHGDYHPLNMVWGEGGIHSVIDWEFCGTRPELYDLALLIGCIGFEEPDNLLKEPVIRLVRNFREVGFGASLSWKHLLNLAATIRWGWMSEWIRRGDKEARKMEAIYIDILVDQQEYIQKRWQ